MSTIEDFLVELFKAERDKQLIERIKHGALNPDKPIKITGKMIKELRESKKMTQQELAEKICVSDKTISKWETCKGLPDISLIEPLAKALDVSIIELMKGEYIKNNNCDRVYIGIV